MRGFMAGMFLATGISVVQAQADCESSYLHSAHEATWDERCSKELGSLTIKQKNSSYDAVTIEICIEQKDGDWDCGHSFVDHWDSMTYWACNPTGRINVRAAKGRLGIGTGCLPNEQGTQKPIGNSVSIVTQYRREAPGRR